MECIYGYEKMEEKLEIRKDGTVPLKPLLATLISHHIDLDRLDFLVRESTYTGLGTLTDAKKIIQSFNCTLIGRQLEVSFPKKQKFSIEANILERSRNYLEIYYIDKDYTGNHAFTQLLEELRRHPEEVPESISPAIRKFLTMERADMTNQEHIELTNKSMKKAIEEVLRTTRNEKISYLCHYIENAKRDYQILYNSESVIRELLRKAIPNFPKDSSCIFTETRVIKPYQKSKFGSTLITTEAGVQRFEDLLSSVNLEPISKTVVAINPELLRLELGISKEEFKAKYEEILQEIITSQTRPKQDFELKYMLPKDAIAYGTVLKQLGKKYEKQNSAIYHSRDVYYDTAEDFSLLAQNSALRTRNGVNYYRGKKSNPYKNKRLTYTRYEEQENSEFTTRTKLEEIGDSTSLKDYPNFFQTIVDNLKEVTLENAEMDQTLEVHNIRKVDTFLVNGYLMDVSINIAKYQSRIYENEGVFCILEISPRDNQVEGRIALLEIKKALEETFPQLKGRTIDTSAYEIAMIDANQRWCNQNRKQATGKMQKLNQIIQKLTHRKKITRLLVKQRSSEQEPER